MAHSRGTPKRKAADIVQESESDSDCIAVASQPMQRSNEVNATAQRRPPLAHADASQMHNKRRRILECVLIPKPAAVTKPHALSLTKRRSQHTLSNVKESQPLPARTPLPSSSVQSKKSARPVGSRSTALGVGTSVGQAPKQASILNFFGASGRLAAGQTTSSITAEDSSGPHSATQRPKRNARRSFHSQVEPDESSGDELGRDDQAPKKRGAMKMKAKVKANIEAEESEFEAEDAISSTNDVSDEDGDAPDDSSSVAPSEHYTDEDVIQTKTKTSKTSARPSVGKKGGLHATAKKASKASAEDMERMLERLNGQSRDLDPNLPPLSSIDDIFQDITKRALDMGLGKALDRLTSRPIRVATMCSGTESPLLALQMVHDALRALGLNTIDVQHIFSAEIVPFKQAYIERNFAPPIIFRDITEFQNAFTSSDIPTATTAYGSSVPIPTGVDIVVAGTSCVDFSNLNNKKKKLSDNGESGLTWDGALAYCRACRPAIIIFENVLGADWKRMLAQYRAIGYDCKGVKVDSKDFYIPQTRQRGYMVCFDKSRTNGDSREMGSEWQTLMRQFQRYASSPTSSFLLTNDQVVARQAARSDENGLEVDWSKCAITQMQYRQDKKIGNARPFTQWQESGTMVPPENGSAPWYHKQVERVLDTIDCSILRKSLPKAGMYDARFKTRIWDLSQNIYMFTDQSPFGITGCITPSGQFFASDAGRQLSYEECLMLQGIPLDKISFTTETAKNVQDLAGNAMTSTVIGSALLAALIVGHDLIDVGEAQIQTSLSSRQEVTLAPTLYRDHSSMQLHACESETSDLDVPSLLRGAKNSARRCHCEGSYGLCEKPLQRCIDCGHTTCTSCGGNPLHNFRQDQTLDKGRISPSAFEQQLRSQLPLQLSFTSMGDFASRMDGSLQYLETVGSAATGVFSFQRVRRTYCWTASYVKQDARLDLVIDGQHAEWRLFALPPKDLACNDKLRVSLEQPIAKAAICGMLFEVEWLWRIPQKRTQMAQIVPQGTTALTWWARNDVPGYGTHSQPDQLRVEVTNESSTLLERSISGTYRYVPKCGKACDSLYQKVREADEEPDRPMYLFLDPTLTGDPGMDEFVFSHNKAQLEYDESRLVIARIKAPWRPWTVEPDESAIPDAEVVIDAIWQTAPFAVALQPHATAVETHASTKLPALTVGPSCQDAFLLASCTTSHCDTLHVMEQDQRSTNMVHDARFLSQNAWIFEAMRRQLSDSGWQTIALRELVTECTSCAPAKPLLRWKFALDNKNLVPYEDPASAAAYERAVKTRPAPMIVNLVAQEHGTQALEFGVSIASLVHRALTRMPSGVRNADVRWMLDTSNTRSTSTSFPQFILKATKGLPYSAELNMSVSLFPKQRLSLAWMRSQEEGQGTQFTIEEAEEAILPVHGWRAEIRASAPIFIRGGICADHPGFGKTITSLALIQAQLLESTPSQIKDDLKARQSQIGALKGLIASTATLIICPSSLVQQWADEIQDKLGSPNGVITIKVTAHFARHSIQDFENAKIIVVSRSVMGTETYAGRLAAFAAIPGPTTITGRSFAQWLQFATSRVPEHLQVLKKTSVSGLRSHVKAKYSEILSSEDFKAAVPSKRLRGKDLAAAQSGKSAKSSTMKTAPAAISVSDIDKPLLEMFYFNRIIIDEFHQHKPNEHAVITALHADKRWALSATPELSDFFDIARMASLLGVPLRIGSDTRGIMKAKNVKRLRQHMTNFELFDAMRQLPSSSMHARIHEVDQLFLDTFVRRNIMDFAGLPYKDTLTPVTLDLDHRAMYTELSQHLNSSQMRIKRGRKKGSTDRQDRLHAAIATSESAEEALSKTAAWFERDVDAFADSGAGLAAAISIRDQEASDMLCEVEAAIKRAQDEEPEPFNGWKKTKLGDGTLGDGATISDVESLIATAPKSDPDKAEDGEEEEEEAATAPGGKRELTAILNGLCDRLVTSRRSLRYLQNIQTLQRGAKGSATSKAYCDSVRCIGYVQAKHDVAVSAFCGHMVCKDCYRHLRDEQHGKQCPADGCTSAMDPHHLLWTSKMGDLRTTVHSPYGAKIHAAMDVLEDVAARHDQAILFVQFDQQVEEVEKALKDRQISAVVVKDINKAASQIAQFRESTEHTVIVLNSSDETAAGSNLQNANHVIFLSPLLKSDQYLYESTMAQAIGRVRRHGQKKQIHVYRIVALDTIDVDILEHRERRLDALTESGAPDITPPAAARKLDVHDEPKPERTQLVKENGHYSLRPQSWLVRCGADIAAGAGEGDVAKVKGKNRVLGWEDFSSLVKFSRAYTEDDD